MVKKHINFSAVLLYSITILLAMVLLVGCDKELDAPTVPPLETGTLSSSKQAVIVDNDNPLSEAVLFEWTAKKNSHIKYKLVFAVGDKTDTVDVSGDLSKKFSNVDFNTLLVEKLKLDIGKTADITVVVKSTIVGIAGNNQTAVSNTLTLTVTPDEKVVPPPAYSKLWIVGDATPNGWNIDGPNVMVTDPTNIYQFKYNEVLKAGQFKIPVATGNWSGDFYMPPTDNPALSSTSVKLIIGGNPDNKWKIENAGPYKILLNIGAEPFIKIAPFTPSTTMHLFGDATTAGWDIANPIAMTVDAVDKNVFTWTGVLTEGQFRFPVAAGSLDGAFFVAPSVDAPLTSTQVGFADSGTPANNFKVAAGSGGTYKITINQFKETISIVKQ